MKKLLLVLVMLFAFTFVACDNAETTTLAPTTLAGVVTNTTQTFGGAKWTIC